MRRFRVSTHALALGRHFFVSAELGLGVCGFRFSARTLGFRVSHACWNTAISVSDSSREVTWYSFVHCFLGCPKITGQHFRLMSVLDAGLPNCFRPYLASR